MKKIYFFKEEVKGLKAYNMIIFINIFLFIFMENDYIRT
jgi:hypothetical protein